MGIDIFWSYFFLINFNEAITKKVSLKNNYPNTHLPQNKNSIQHFAVLPLIFIFLVESVY